MFVVLFAIGWVCVLSYYYQLCDKKTERMAQRLQRRVARRYGINEEFSVSSVSTVIIDDYRTPPPAYNAVFKNPVFEGDDDKLPSYEESIGNIENIRSDESRHF